MPRHSMGSHLRLTAAFKPRPRPSPPGLFLHSLLHQSLDGDTAKKKSPLPGQPNPSQTLIPTSTIAPNASIPLFDGLPRQIKYRFRPQPFQTPNFVSSPVHASNSQNMPLVCHFGKHSGCQEFSPSCHIHCLKRFRVQWQRLIISIMFISCLNNTHMIAISRVNT